MRHKHRSGSLGLLVALVGVTILAVNLPRNLAARHRSESLGDPLRPDAQRGPAEPYTKLPLSFEPNVGQADPRIRFLARGPGYGAFFTGTEIHFSFQTQETTVSNDLRVHKLAQHKGPSGRGTRSTTFRMSFVNASPNAKLVGLDELPGKSNYLIGNDRAKWRTNIRNYGRVKCHDVYPGVDLLYYGNQRQLEYDLVVAPGADPNQIRLAFDGVRAMRVESGTGDLLLETGAGQELRHARPNIYQQIGTRRVAVAGNYQILDEQTVAFAVTEYDQAQSLVIDPTVVFTTFITGNSADVPVGVAADNSGNSYITGFTISTDFPMVGGLPALSKDCDLFDAIGFNCNFRAFVAKLSPTGTLLFSTFFGGEGFDLPKAIAVDLTGIFITGRTNSLDFGSGQYAYGSSSDGNAFVAKLTLNGEVLSWAIRFGGVGGSNEANAIALDSSHAAYVAGKSCAVDFPTSQYFSTTLQPWQKAYGGDCDAFVVKVDPYGFLNGGYSTYVGGSSFDEALAIGVDSQGYAVITGDTCSPNFPNFNAPARGFPGNGCTQPGQTGGNTAFVTKILPNGSGGLYSVFLGGTKTSDVIPADYGNGIFVDAIGNAYVTGNTISPNFYTSSAPFNVIQPTKPACPYAICTSAFVANISPLGTVRLSTYLGGNSSTVGEKIVVNSTGQIYVAGNTAATNLPGAPAIAPNPTAGFVMKLSPTLGSVLFTTFLGADIRGLAIQPQPPSRVALISFFSSTVLHTTGIRYRPRSDVNNFNNVDGFVVKLNDPPLLVIRQ
jgi:beta-propeller repeat-containing protein